MNISISLSKDLLGGEAANDADITRPVKTETVFQDPIARSIQYTFHRHSAPKNIIYFRCSDKCCPARLHFDTDLRTFSMKNQHLHPSMHKLPTTGKVITTSELILNPNYSTRGPLVIDTSTSLSENLKQGDSFVPSKRSQSHFFNDSAGEKSFMLRFCINSSENVEEFRKAVLKKCLVTRVVHLSSSKKFTNQICENKSETFVEVYTVTQFIGKVLVLINHYFERGAEVLFYVLD